MQDENKNAEYTKAEENSDGNEPKTETELTDETLDETKNETLAEAMPIPKKRNPKAVSKKVKEFFEWAEMIIISFCAVILIFTFVARPAVVVGDSMLNTLHEGETLIISPITAEYDYMDIVIFQIPQNIGGAHGDAIVKRVIATEGQWVDVDLKTWEVFVADTEEGLLNAEPLSEPYVNYKDCYITAQVSFPLQVPEGCLFVMGDNRSASWDSRAFGCIKEEYIMGKVLFRLFPLNKFGAAG